MIGSKTALNFELVPLNSPRGTATIAANTKGTNNQYILAPIC